MNQLAIASKGASRTECLYLNLLNLSVFISTVRTKPNGTV